MLWLEVVSDICVWTCYVPRVPQLNVQIVYVLVIFLGGGVVWDSGGWKLAEFTQLSFNGGNRKLGGSDFWHVANFTYTTVSKETLNLEVMRHYIFPTAVRDTVTAFSLQQHDHLITPG